MARRPKYLTDPKTFNVEYKRLVTLKTAAQDLHAELGRIVSELKGVDDLPQQAKSHVRYLEGRRTRADNLIEQAEISQRKAEELTAKIETKQKEFDDLFERLDSNKNTAEEMLESAKLTSEEIDKLERRIEELAEETRRTLGSAVSGSLSASFARRARFIGVSRWVWLVILTLAAVGAPFLAVYVFRNVNTEGIVGPSVLAGNIFKLATLSPLIFFISYASIQYSRERDLQERYAFKASIAQSLPAYTKLMKDEFFGDDQPNTRKDDLTSARVASESSTRDDQPNTRKDDLTKFALESVRKIYEEPFLIRQQKRAFVQINRSGAVVNAEEDISGTLDVKAAGNVAGVQPTDTKANVITKKTTV